MKNLTKVVIASIIALIACEGAAEAKFSSRGFRAGRSSISRSMSRPRAVPRVRAPKALPAPAKVAKVAKVPPVRTVAAPPAPAAVHHHHTTVETKSGGGMMPYVTGALIGHALTKETPSHAAVAAAPVDVPKVSEQPPLENEEERLKKKALAHREEERKLNGR